MNLEGLEGASYTTATYDGDFKQDEEGTEKRETWMELRSTQGVQSIS